MARTFRPHRTATGTDCPLVESLEGRQLFAASLAVTSVTNATALAGNQVEGQVVVNPTNAQNLVVVGATDASNGSQLFVSRSTNGGASWGKTFIGAAQDGLIANTPRVDARATFDAFGNLYVAYMCAASSSEVRVMVARSSNGGASFASVTAAVSGTAYDPDCPALATGVDANKSRDQAIWLSFTDYNSGRVKVVHATASGLGRWSNFSGMTTVSDRFGTYSSLAVGPSGEVAVAWQNDDASQGPAAIYMDVDVDGAKRGAGFGTDKFVTGTNVGGWDFIPAQPNRSIDAEPKIAFDLSTGATRGRLYLLYTDEPVNESNDTDVFLRYTDTRGGAWSNRVRVNDDATAASQFLPALAVDRSTGNVGMSWYDARNSANNSTVQYYAAVSTDHGASVSPNVRVSPGTSSQAGAAYTSTLIGDLDLGDSTGLAFVNGKLVAVWADNSNSTLNNPDGTGSKFDLYVGVIQVSVLA